MTLGKFIHWLGILLILLVCFYDVLSGKEQNVLAYKSYAAIVFGFLLTLLGIEVTRKGRRACLLEIVADWLFEEEPETAAPGQAPGNDAPEPPQADRGN